MWKINMLIGMDMDGYLQDFCYYFGKGINWCSYYEKYFIGF